MDNTLCMSTQVARTCQGAYFQLHKIAKIRKYLTTHACKTIVHALVTSRLDCGNAVFFGVNVRLIQKLQMVPNFRKFKINYRISLPKSKHKRRG